MIRVNLLAQTPGHAPKREWLPKDQRSAAVGLVLLLSTAVGVTSWWWYLRHQRSNVEQSITVAETELVRLKAVAQLVDRATARRMELAERLDLIERLRGTMRGPVRLLQTVSSSVPHGLWLLEIKQTGTTVQLDGRSLSVTAVTDFARRMQESGFFQMPVEITTTTEIVDEVSVIRFVMRADVAAAAAVPARATAVAAAGSAAPTPADAGGGAQPAVAATAPAAVATGTVVPPVRPGGGF